MLRTQGPPDVSLSIPGLVLKARHVGLPLPFEALAVAGWLYSAAILWVTYRLAIRPIASRLAPLAWLVVLGLATFRSPFLPPYGMFVGAWIAAVLLALVWNDGHRRWLVALLWLPLLWMTAGPQTTTVPVVLDGSISPPDQWWRLTHPFELGE